MKNSHFVEYVMNDLFPSLWRLSANPMFGGFGIYRDEVMFALVYEDILYLKTDDASRSDFIKRGAEPLTYLSRGKTVALSYWNVPAEILEDRDQLREWAERSYRINMQAGAVKAKKKRGKRT